MAEKKKKKVVDGCIGCGEEPAARGELGPLCRGWISYHEGQTMEEKSRYIRRVQKQQRRIGTFLIARKRRVA